MLRCTTCPISSWTASISHRPLVVLSCQVVALNKTCRRVVSNISVHARPFPAEPPPVLRIERLFPTHHCAQRVIKLPITTAMTKSAHYSSAAAPKEKKQVMEPKPSASIVLLSPTNQVLLLHRVKTSSAFPSAHVFPGGNLSEFHDGPVPPPEDSKRHEDSQAYRLGAVRETFEESGILLARDKTNPGSLLNLPAAERDKARKAIYGNESKFNEWLDSVGGIADIGISL